MLVFTQLGIVLRSQAQFARSVLLLFCQLHYHCVKSVHIRSYSGPHFPTFGLYVERSTQTRKNVDQNNTEYRHFSRRHGSLELGAKITRKRHPRKKASIKLFLMKIGNYFLNLFNINFKKLLQFFLFVPASTVLCLAMCTFSISPRLLRSRLIAGSLLAHYPLLAPRLLLTSHYCLQSFQDNLKYNRILSFKIILKIFVVNLLIQG